MLTTPSEIAFGHGADISVQQAIFTSNMSLLGNWFHAAVVYDSVASTASIYVNGQSVVSTAATYIASWQGGAQMSVAGGLNGIDYPLIGSLQCAGWFNYAVTSQQIADVYNAQIGGGCSIANLPE